MKSAYQFKCEKRDTLGRGAARELRRGGNVPGILYSSKLKPVSFFVAEKDLTKEYNKGNFRSKLVELKIGNENFYALAREIQTHPVSDRIEHVDFLQVDDKSVVSVAVPVKVVGVDKAPGLKQGGALNIVRHTVKLVCTPDSIPAEIKVDVSAAKIGDSIHISSVQLPQGVKPEIQNRDFTLITIAGRQKKDEEAATTAAPAEGEAAAGAAPAGDAAKKEEPKKD